MHVSRTSIAATLGAVLSATALVLGPASADDADTPDGVELGRTESAAAELAPIIQNKNNITVQLLALNDFHGNVAPPTGSSGRVGLVDAGGAEYLSTHIKSLEALNRNTLVVSAGDAIGASPLLSALFHDEPTIEALNQVGLDLNAVGNHEFDEGTAELQRMQNGGCHPVDGCQDGDGFDGADFQFLAANVVNKTTKQKLFPATAIKTIAPGIKVGFIGLTLEGTPNIVSPSGVAGYRFLDEVVAINNSALWLRERGVKAIVVLIHEGGLPATFDINGCAGISGPIVDIVNNLRRDVDMVISGHTHQPYNCRIDGIPVTSAYSFGRLVTDIDMVISKSTRDVVKITVDNKIVTRDVAKDPAITALIDEYSAVAAPIANRPIGQITADILRAAGPSGESPLGNVIADGQLAATAGATTGNAVAAFMNPGGVRADLTYLGSPAGEGDGVVTYGEAFTVQPFGNSLVTMSLTGAQIDTVLEQQFCGLNDTTFKILQPSASVSYAWSESAALLADPGCTGNAISDLEINGVAVDPTATYRVTVNSFLADGGDGFGGLIAGTNRLGGAVDTDAFEAYLVANGPLAPAATTRISKLA